MGQRSITRGPPGRPWHGPDLSLLVFLSSSRLDGSMETTNEILDSTSQDCPLVTQAYSAAVAKGPHAPSSPTALGKGWAEPGAEPESSALLHSGAGPAGSGLLL